MVAARLATLPGGANQYREGAQICAPSQPAAAEMRYTRAGAVSVNLGIIDTEVEPSLPCGRGECSKFEQRGDMSDLLAECEKLYRDMLKRPACERREAAMMLASSWVSRLSPEDRGRFLRGKMGEIQRSMAGCESRSGASELFKAAELGVILVDLGMVKEVGQGFRDVKTGQRVNTRLRELSRLKWDWSAEDSREWLARNWSDAAAMPLANLKAWVRGHNPNARTGEVCNG